jgi:threonine synthase
MDTRTRDLLPVKTYKSDFLAEYLGVDTVYIRDEGGNMTGSMKDYLVEHGLYCGRKQNCDTFTTVSSGSQAFSLANYVARNDCKAVVFAPASSSKIELLCRYPGTFVVGVEDAIFEDVYSRFSRPLFPELYNMNVCNEALLHGFGTVANDIARLVPIPSHIMAGVGNGSYLAGIVHGLEATGEQMPKIVPVGMAGAFPTETAFLRGHLLAEHDEFGVDENTIDAAEGSIAIASYSMPQLIHAMRISEGFPLGDLTNKNLAEAYRVLAQDKELVGQGTVPEATGIMGLAAAIQHRCMFTSNDVLLISFTGSAQRDYEGLRSLVPDIADRLIESAKVGHPHISECLSQPHGDNSNLLIVHRRTPLSTIEVAISRWRETKSD